MADMPAPAHPTDERILAVIGNLTLVAGFMGVKQKACSLMLTDRRIIVAELTKQEISAFVNQTRNDAKTEGKGLLGQWGAQLRTPFDYHERYWRTAPDAALAETSGNFAIERSAIKKVKLKSGIVDDTHTQPDQLTIKTTSAKYKLHVNGSLSVVKEALRTAGIS